jgi:hypothetical protein
MIRRLKGWSVDWLMVALQDVYVFNVTLLGRF